MSTQSIINNIVLKTPNEVKSFVSAIEKSRVANFSKKDIQYESISLEGKQLKDFFKNINNG